MQGTSPSKKMMSGSDSCDELIAALEAEERQILEGPSLKAKEEYKLRCISETSEQNGSLSECTNDSEFLTVTTSHPLVVCHFYHPEYQKCQDMDSHLQVC